LASKELEIVVSGRDNASATFAKVGDSATGLSQKLSGINEVGHGLSKSFRAMHHAFLAFELVPVGLDAVGALMVGLTLNQA